MSSVKAEPGFWQSAFSAADAVRGLKDYGQLQCGDDDTLYWVEYRPESGGRNLICRWHRGRVACLTPDDFDVRSRVHEYGGASWCLLDDRLAFVNNRDQQLYLQPLDGSRPQRLTSVEGGRFGEPVWDRARNRLIAVQELHGSAAVLNRLVAVELDSGAVSVLHQQHDFYAYPTLDRAGRQVAFIAWDHPHQPWTQTRLHHAALERQGGLAHCQVVAGADRAEALTQPLFDRHNALLAVSDRDGYWSLYRYLAGDGSASAQGGNDLPEPVFRVAGSECATAAWQLGSRHTAELESGTLVSAWFTEGRCRLLAQGSAGADTAGLAPAFSHFRNLVARGERLYCVAQAPDRLPAILALDLAGGAPTILTGGDCPLGEGDCALPHPLAFPTTSTENAESAYGFFYPPANRRYPQARRPPLLLFLHGGPTAATYPVFSPHLQYWTQRGFAVLDLNYRGSTGFGRAYRLRLQGNWGLTDVADAVAAVDHLARLGAIDPAKAFIRGSSAGGFTTLAVLVASDRFRAGASLYGVSDPLALSQQTHKFESRYLDWLIGDPQADQAIYRQRAPLHHAAQIRCPVIFFQGLQDKVVVPAQTRAMVDALRASRIPVELHEFAEEGHGFRHAGNLQRVLALELAFYQRQLGIEG